MEPADVFLKYAVLAALYIFTASLVFPLYRLFKGPSLPDRVVALDQIGVIIVGIMVCDVIYTGERVLLDVVLVVAFMLVFSAMIISRYLYKQKKQS